LTEVGVISALDWQARRQFLERRLVRPLRTYRSEVLQHYIKNERTKEAADSVSGTIEPTANEPAVSDAPSE